MVDLDRDPETGKLSQQWHMVKGTRKVAERALGELLHSVETGDYIKPTKLTVGE